ncbi:MAG: hypothetical protein M9916_04990 [Crocinitomicaceae bacterium]|nr:hypothetical protein [Crocinitomicaceae bacterium]
MVTEQSDKNIDCTYPGTTTCTDERWDDCTPGSGISNPGTPPVVPPVRTR